MKDRPNPLNETAGYFLEHSIAHKQSIWTRRKTETKGNKEQFRYKHAKPQFKGPCLLHSHSMTVSKTLPTVPRFLPRYSGSNSSFHEKKDYEAKGMTDHEMLQQLEYHQSTWISLLLQHIEQSTMTMEVGLHLLPPSSMHKAEVALQHPSGEASQLPASPARKLRYKHASHLQSLCSQQIWEEKAEGSVLVLCPKTSHIGCRQKICLPFHIQLTHWKNPNQCKPSALLWLTGFVPRSLKSHNMPLTVRVLWVTFSATETACWE